LIPRSAIFVFLQSEASISIENDSIV